MHIHLQNSIQKQNLSLRATRAFRTVATFFQAASLAKLRFAGCLVFLSLFLSACDAEQVTYRAVGVHDGDTVTLIPYECTYAEQKISPENSCPKTKVRLIGLDAPELEQHPWGLKSKEFTEAKILNQKIYLEKGIQPIDKYGRTLGYILYDPTNSEKPEIKNMHVLNEEILANGLAQIYIFPMETKYSARLKEAEYSARSKSINIWDAEKGLKISPGKYRAKNKAKQKRDLQK